MTAAAAPATASLLEVSDLRVQFRSRRRTVHAVNGVSFAIGEGETVGLVGETGCGKSATVRAIIGLLKSPGRVTAGAVRLEGTDLVGLQPRQLRQIRGARIGFVPQNPFGALNPVLRIERQFRNVIRAHGRGRRGEIRSTALDMLDAVGIADPDRVLRGYAHELSGGMAQRVVIALAMVLNPRLVVADEPTTGLDLTIQRQILDLIRDLAETEGRSMLLVTHDVGVVAQYCSRVLVMYAGQVVESGPVRRVLTEPAHPYTEALLAAVPRRGERLVGAQGTVPTLLELPPGCFYYDRCQYRSDPRCATEAPSLREVGPEHWAAVHYDKGAGIRLPAASASAAPSDADSAPEDM
ncbi:MAG: ABC transporter ATP-binding protein [bacterium]|nr:ABC transporter ATP-binding protein [bacterium]